MKQMSWLRATWIDFLNLVWRRKVLKKIRLLKQASFWGKRLQEFHFGHLVLSKIAFVISLVNLIILFSLKYDFDPTSYIIVLSVLSTFFIWYFGRWMERKKIRKYFQEATFKDVEIKGSLR